MTMSREYEQKYSDVYEFAKAMLEAEFILAQPVTPEANLHDNLGLSVLDWFVLADHVERRFNVRLDQVGDLAVFEFEAPTIDWFVRRILRKLDIPEPKFELKDDDGILLGVIEIIEEVTGIETHELQPEKLFVSDLDIDSLSMIEIVVQCENRFGIKIPDQDTYKMQTIRQLVEYIHSANSLTPEH